MALITRRRRETVEPVAANQLFTRRHSRDGKRQGGAVIFIRRGYEVAVPLSTFSLWDHQHTKFKVLDFLSLSTVTIFNLILKVSFVNFHLPVLFRRKLSLKMTLTPFTAKWGILATGGIAESKFFYCITFSEHLLKPSRVHKGSPHEPCNS
jgi:hypothetical protein